jgi:hypothetical protein
MMAAIILIDEALWQDPSRAILEARLRLRGTEAVPVSGPPGHRALLRAAAGRTAWLATRDPAWIAAAGTAGLVGVVLVGVPVPPEPASLVVAGADDLLDAPRVMVPPGGGCWHA